MLSSSALLTIRRIVRQGQCFFPYDHIIHPAGLSFSLYLILERNYIDECGR